MFWWQRKNLPSRFGVQSSCEDTYSILQKKLYLCIYKDSFGAKILWDDWTHNDPSDS